MHFIPPMLATRLEDPRRLADPRYSAGPKLDGQRAQLHIREHRTVHAFSRPGRELITLPGLAWLRELRWPIASAVLDGEAVAGDGSEGIQAVFEARTRSGRSMAFTRSTCWRSTDTLVGQGGEDLVLKERTSLYRPGIRSPAWLKLKPKLSLEVVVTGGSADPTGRASA